MPSIDWLCTELGVAPPHLATAIDGLFRRAIEDFAAAVNTRKSALLAAAKEQRQPYEGRDLPEPGADPELVAIIRSALAGHLGSDPAPPAWQALTGQIQAHFAQENKRRNLVGEGFEDLLAEVIRRLWAGTGLEARTRELIQNVPGFNKPRVNEKDKKVDLVVHGGPRKRRVLATAKWSIRADREEQFATDFDAYARLEAAGKDFEHVLVTNEFDPARLVAACERRVVNHSLFRHVVHLNPSGVLAAYGPKPGRSAGRVAEFVRSHRLISLEAWLRALAEG